ncbi:MAG: hypothetical protein ACRD16_13455 [Thermoanaerobaculia bacterium]
MKIARVILVLAFSVAAGRRVSAQAVPLDVEAGYRFVDVSGNSQMYRSQINERDGFLLRSFLLSSPGPTAMFDTFRVDASDLGAGPAGSFGARASLTGKYDLHLSYRRTELYSALPGFANPLLDEGILPGEQTYSRVRHVLDVELKLLPGEWITPILGYTSNRNSGPGRTTYHVGQDEFRLTDELDDRDEEFRVGADFDAGPVSGQVLQGWRRLREVETQSLAPGAGGGNDPGTVLGVPVSLTDLNRSTKTVANTPVTSAYVTGRFGERVKIVGSYLYAAAEGDTGSQEDLTGSLVSFEISRFFGGLADTTSARARNTMWRGGGRAEVSLAEGVDLVAGYTKNHTELDGFALISSLYMDSVTFGGQDPKDLLAVLQADTSVERTDEVFDATIEARRFGPLAVRAGWSQTRQDVIVAEDPSEIVLPGGQGGAFRRTIRSLEAGATFAQNGVSLGADFRRERADDAVLRTDFLDRDRYRLRAAWNMKEIFRLSAAAEQIDSSNDRTGVGYDGRLRQYGGTLEGWPAKILRLRLSAEKYQADSKILFRVPQTFDTDRSIHEEDGRSLEGGFSLLLSPVSVEGAYGRFRNGGSFPFDIDRASARASVDVTKNASLIAEWRRDKYREGAAAESGLGSYDANRYGLFVRWRQ